MKPPEDPLVLPATGGEVRLDPDAQTLTFEHRGRTILKAKREASPVVVRLGEIESVSHKHGTLNSWFQIVRRDRAGWHKNRTNDLHSVITAANPSEFAKRVEAAVALAEPIEPPPPPPSTGRDGPQPRALLPDWVDPFEGGGQPARNDDGPGFFGSLFGGGT